MKQGHNLICSVSSELRKDGVSLEQLFLIQEFDKPTLRSPSGMSVGVKLPEQKSPMLCIFCSLICDGKSILGKISGRSICRLRKALPG